MRLLIEDLKNRNYSLFILGLLYFLFAFFCISFIFLEKDHLTVSIPFKTAISSFYSALMLWSVGWMNEYLYQKQTRKFFSSSYLIVYLLFLFISVTTVIRGLQPNPHAELPLERLNFQIYIITQAIFIFLFSVNTWLLFSQQKMPVSQHYSWGVRLGYLIFLLPLITDWISHLMLYSNELNPASRIAYFLSQWENPVGGLRIAYLMGVFALQILPLTSNYVFKKKKEVQVFALSYLISMILLVIMTMLRQPLIPS